MRKTVVGIFVIVQMVILSVDSFAVVSSPVPMASGDALGGVVLGPNPSEAEEFAVAEFQTYVYQMTGHFPGLEGFDTTYPGRRCLIGSAAPAAIADIDDLAADSYVIRADSNDIILAGNTPRGTLYAVYDFLKTQGCGWFMPGGIGEVVPAKAALEVPEPNRIESPDYDVRGMHIESAQFYYTGGWIPLNADEYYDWCVRNRINTFLQEYSQTSDFGAHRGYSHIQTTNHTWALFLLDDHSEWWALVDGVRTKLSPLSGLPNQLCVSNQALRDYVVDYILQYFADDPNASIFALNANDYTYWCECLPCRALDPDGGTGPWIVNQSGIAVWPNVNMSDRSIDFVNEITNRVNAVYPDKKIEMFSYAATTDPPTTITVDPNVLVKFTWHGAPVNKSVLDTNYPINVSTLDMFAGWQAAGAENLGLYDYGNFWHPDSPNFWFYHTADFFKSFNEQFGLRHSLGECDHSFVQSLMWYNLRARCMWDKDVDYLTEINDICNRFYGSAGSRMYSYYLFMSCKQMTAVDWDAIGNLGLSDYNVPVMEQGRAILEQAILEANGDADIIARIGFARLGHAYMTLEVGKNESPLSNASQKAVGDAYKSAYELAQDYWNIVFYTRGGYDILLSKNLWFVPFWQVWDRDAEWTANENPDDDLIGNNVWNYQTVERGNPLGQTSPWYEQTATDMIWDGTYSCWRSSIGSAPQIKPDHMLNYVPKTKNPMVRWVNSANESFMMEIAGTLTVRWVGSPCNTDVDVAIAFNSTGFTPLLTQTLTKPVSGTDVVVTVAPMNVQVNPNDEIRISMRQTDITSAGVLEFYDDLTFSVVQPTPTYCGDDGTVYLSGDISGPDGTPDCYVDWFDLVAMAVQWLERGDCENCQCTQVGDITGTAGFLDLAVNFFDITVVAEQWMECNDPVDPTCSL